MNKKRDDVRYLLIKKYDVGLPDAIRRQAQNVDTAVIRHVPLQLIVLPSLVIKKETVWNESVQSRWQTLISHRIAKTPMPNSFLFFFLFYYSEWRARHDTQKMDDSPIGARRWISSLDSSRSVKVNKKKIEWKFIFDWLQSRNLRRWWAEWTWVRIWLRLSCSCFGQAEPVCCSRGRGHGPVVPRLPNRTLFVDGTTLKEKERKKKQRIRTLSNEKKEKDHRANRYCGLSCRPDSSKRKRRKGTEKTCDCEAMP